MAIPQSDRLAAVTGAGGPAGDPAGPARGAARGEPDDVFTVLDVGGTTLRTGSYDPAVTAVTRVRRVPVEGMARHPHDSVAGLQHRVVDQIVHEVRRHTAGTAPRAVGVAFAGPISAGGLVLAAPTVWGRRGQPLPLGQ
ncbi:hypothetical protein ABT382_38050, partial [Streptomyces pharetrae]